MIIADWIAIGLIVAFAVLGWFVGFGNGLRFFTKGIFGIIISVVICYFFLGVVLSWPFVVELSDTINLAILGDGSSEVRNWLVTNSFVNKAMWAVILFVVLQILRAIIVKFIVGIFNSKNIFMKVINKSLGAVFFVALLIVIALIAVHIINIVDADLFYEIESYLQGSALGLEFIIEHNPMTYLIEQLQYEIVT